MVRELKIKAVSFKSRGVLVDGGWINASRDFDLKQLRVGEIYRLEITEDLRGRYTIQQIIRNEISPDQFLSEIETDEA